MNTRMRPSSSFFQTTSRSPYQILRSCPLWSVSLCYRYSARWWFPEWPPRLSCRATIWSQSICFTFKVQKHLWKFKNELHYRGLVGDLWDVHLCKHFGEPCGAPVCALFSVFTACMEHRRDFSHIYSLVWLLELGFGTTSTSVLLFNACAISCCHGGKYLIVQCNKRAGVFCCWIFLNSFGVESVMWRGTHFLFLSTNLAWPLWLFSVVLSFYVQL